MHTSGFLRLLKAAGVWVSLKWWGRFSLNRDIKIVTACYGGINSMRRPQVCQDRWVEEGAREERGGVR